MRVSHSDQITSIWLMRLAAAIFGGVIFSVAFAADLELPPDVYGNYSPGGDCAKQPRIIVNKAGVHLDTAVGKRGPLPVMVSYTFVGGARYSGIQIWALVKHGGRNRWGDDNTPVILTFNADEKRGALTAELENPGKERPVTLDGPLASVAQAGRFRLCSTQAK
ncbi:hypothetical protein V4F39_07940 [Aquincola sp. MAHUQ-54]|uniref:Uncharacterized protein n=1 Tax=Aquincola agrisoli TaxID=3119538 RepID=A0AAW9QBW0_9BURK